MKKRLVLGVSAAAILSACVTINIYFPAAAAEKAADKIIDEVWQLKQGQQGTKPDTKPGTKPDTKPDTNPAVKPESKPAVKPAADAQAIVPSK